MVPLLFSAAVSDLLLLYFTSNCPGRGSRHVPSQVPAGGMGQARRLRCGQREGGAGRGPVVALAQMSLQLYKVL